MKKIASILILAFICFATTLFAAPPRAFDGRNVPRGYTRCHVCNGRGVGKPNFFGWTRRCERCDGTGLMRVARPHRPAPKPVIKHHKPKPQPKPALKHEKPSRRPAKHVGGGKDRGPKNNGKPGNPPKGSRSPRKK